MSTDPVDAAAVDPSEAPLPATPPTETEAKHALAAWLTELSGGQLEIEYQPGAIWSNEDGYLPDAAPSRGHLWRIDRTDADDEDDTESVIMNFDDRWGPVPTLAAAQLRRVGNLYFRAAKQLEEAVETGKPMPPPSSQQSHVIVRVAAEWKPASKENYRHCPNWKDAPSEFEPVAMFNPNATFSRMAYYRLEDFNRMSMYHTPEGEPRLWMVAIPSTKALPLNLPSWESIKDAQPIDYDDGDLIGWHFDYREEWIQAQIEAARSLDPALLIVGVRASQ